MVTLGPLKLECKTERRAWFRPLLFVLAYSSKFGLISADRAGRLLAKYGVKITVAPLN